MFSPKVVDFQSFQRDAKTPPQSLEAEEAILGGILFDPNAIERVLDLLQPEMFYLAAHAEIYRASSCLHQQSQPTDLISVSRWLGDRELLEKIGGKLKLLALLDTVVSAVNIDYLAKIVVEKAKRRQLLQVAARVMQVAQHEPDWQAALSQAEMEIFGLTDAASEKGLRTLGDILVDEYARIEQIQAGGETIGYSTGFYDLDAKTQGLKPGTLTIVAGRPAMGKSAFVANIGRVIAAHLPVALFSLEMSGGQVARRLLSAETGIEASRIGAGQISDQDWEVFGRAMTRLSALGFKIDESEAITPSMIRSQCRRLRSEHGAIGAIIIDYLHLMLDGSDDEVRELGKITRQCKRLARELNAPVILLSQLSRAVESRSDKRPQMSDLRSSGAIEQDADLILFLYREEYYRPETSDRGIAEVIIAKQREGPTGTIKLLFEPQFTRFRNLAKGGC